MPPDSGETSRGWVRVSPLELIEYFSERAGVYEYDARLTREQAEAAAEKEAKSRYVVYRKEFDRVP